MLKCNILDYIELACMHRIPVRLTMKQSDFFEGVAEDIVLGQDRQECLLIKIDGIAQQIVLDDIQSMQALVENFHFDLVQFN